MLLPFFFAVATNRLRGDGYAVSLTALLGWTQGVLAVACMKEAPDAVEGTAKVCLLY